MLFGITLGLKSVFALLSGIVGIASFVPYIRDTLRRKTEPHIYTWLIWTLTTGTAAAALWYGRGGWGVVLTMIYVFFDIVIVLLALRYGTKNIVHADTLTLVAALCAIVVWWQLDQPIAAVIIVSVIDAFGYLPTIRKAYAEPWSETPWAWILQVVADAFAILALTEYNVLTTTYLITISVFSMIIFGVCIIRRPRFARPATFK